MSANEVLNARIRSATAQARNHMLARQAGTAGPADDPQPRLARELYNAWLADPEAPHAGRALAAAFQMWGNAGLPDEIEKALPRLDVNAPYWNAVLRAAERAYWKAGRGREHFAAWLHGWENVLTHESSRSALFEMLGMHYWFTGRLDQARMYYTQLAALPVDRTCLGRAHGALYEFDNLQPGQPAPLFEGSTITGESFRLLDQRGNAVVIDFWSTECGACWPEMEFLRQIRKEYPEDMLAMIGVSNDQMLDEMIRVVREENLNWPHIREPIARFEDRLELGSIARMYNAQVIPRAVLIDRDGRVVANNLRGTLLLQTVRETIES